MVISCRHLTLVAAIVAVLFGCDSSNRPTEPGVYINEKRHCLISELKPGDAVIRVNGEEIPKRAFTALLILRNRLWCLQNGKDEDAFSVEEEEIRGGQHVVLELIHHALFAQYAREKSIVPTAEQIAAAERDLLKAMKKPNSSIETLANRLGGDVGELFRTFPRMAAQDALLRQSVTTNDLDSVSEAEINERIEFVRAFDANADAMNEKARKRLLEARGRILAGASIVDEAAKIADAVNPQYAREWGVFQIQEFPADEELHKWLRSAKVGDVSEPVDVEDGLAIVKLVATGKGPAPAGAEPPVTYTLVRCTVKACERMRHQERPEMIAQILEWKRVDAQRTLGTMLTARAVIEYPNGTNLFDRVKTKGQ